MGSFKRKSCLVCKLNKNKVLKKELDRKQLSAVNSAVNIYNFKATKNLKTKIQGTANDS